MSSSVSKKAAALIAKLRSKSGTSRDGVVEELAQFGPSVVSPLMKALAQNDDYRVRMAAASEPASRSDRP